MSDETAKTEACFLNSPAGWLKVSADASGLTGLEIIAEPPKALGSVTLPHLKEAYRQLSEYFRGERVSFTLPLDLGPAFQHGVWERLAGLPLAATLRPEELAATIEAREPATDATALTRLELETTTIDI
jgi:methylated-DNA-[protein]-cysteine S-methyltransferase